MYPYISDNNLYEKQSYMYSDYFGMMFLKEYLDSRNHFIKNDCNLGKDSLEEFETGGNPVRRELLAFSMKMKSGIFNCEIKSSVDRYTKSFEVRKRLYIDYEDNMRPKADADFKDYDSYLVFANVLLQIYGYTNCLKYLNCLLKLDDTLLSIQKQLSDQQRGHLSRILNQELTCFYQLAENIGIDLENTK